MRPDHLPAGEGGEFQFERWEGQAKTGLRAQLSRLLSRLPAIWGARRAARRLAGHLEQVEVPGELPSEDLLAWVEALCRTPHRRAGTPEGLAATAQVADAFSALGLEPLIDPIGIRVWRAERWRLSVEGSDCPCSFVPFTGFTPEGGTRAPLVYVDRGRAADFSRVDVAGKLVVAEVPFVTLPTGALVRALRGSYGVSDPQRAIGLARRDCLTFARENFLGGCRAEDAPAREVYWQAVRRGAVGLCLLLRDHPSGNAEYYAPYDGIPKPVPALWFAGREVERLRRAARHGAVAELVLAGDTSPGTTHNVWATLPGSSDRNIIVTCHHDSPYAGYVEDGLGMAHVLAQAKVWSRLPKAERRANLIFVATAGHFYGSVGAHHFARTHAELMGKTDVVIGLEHLGARDCQWTDGAYRDTGRAALSALFVSPSPEIIAPAIAACDKHRPPATAILPADFFARAPPCDASGLVVDNGVPVVSWIAAPLYLLDSDDTRDKLDPALLPSYHRMATQLVANFMHQP